MNSIEQLIEQYHLDEKVGELLDHALLREELYCLGEVVSSEPAEDASVTITELEDESGHVFIPCFTTLDMMEGWADEGEGYLTLSGKDLLNMVQDAMVIINPESELEYVLTPQHIHELLKR